MKSWGRAFQAKGKKDKGLRQGREEQAQVGPGGHRTDARVSGGHTMRTAENACPHPALAVKGRSLGFILSTVRRGSRVWSGAGARLLCLSFPICVMETLEGTH